MDCLEHPCMMHLSEERLAAREVIYALMRRLFSAPPDADCLAVLSSDGVREALCCFEGVEAKRLRAEWDLLGERLCAWRKRPEEELERWRDEFTQLFYVPGKYAASPWASVYLSRDRVALGESTVVVKRLYQTYGFELRDEDHAVADSLELELDFLARMARRMRESCERGSEAALRRDAQGSKAFLSQHLLLWLPRFLKRLEGNERAQAYYDLASLLVSCVRADAACL